MPCLAILNKWFGLKRKSATAAGTYNVLVSGQFTGEANAHKRSFFKALEKPLKRQGVRVHFFCQSIISAPREAVETPEAVNTFINKWEANAAWQAACQLESAYKEISPEASAHTLATYGLALQAQLAKQNTTHLLLWNQFTPQHSVARMLAEAAGLKVLYIHQGLLPETIVLEADGQMAESWPATNSETFNNTPLTQAQLSAANIILSRAAEEKLSRKNQGVRAKVYKPQHVQGSHPKETYTEKELANLPAYLQKLKKEKGVKALIFYAGGNDYYSGLVPADTKRARLHSPHFENTLAALEALLNSAEKNNWHIVYKPHPNVAGKALSQPTPAMLANPHLTCLTQGSVFECMESCCLTTTLLSQTAYQARILGRPVCMLGVNQLNASGSVFELTKPTELSATINTALAGAKNTQKSAAMQRAFTQHAARLLQQYLLPYNSPFINKALGTGPNNIAKKFVRILQTGRIY